MIRPLSLFKPEYLFRPSQIFRRLAREWSSTGENSRQVELPWGLPLRIRKDEDLGRQIWAMGIFDLAVSETLWRLTETADTVADVGANIGCMSSLLVSRVGMRGKVHAFEPHPQVFADLQANAKLWAGNPGRTVPIKLHQCALGEAPGSASLSVPERFEENRGLATLVPGGVRTAETIEVKVDTLDHVIGDIDRLAVVKIDVEGHELKVLQGAEGLLARKVIRNIVFEERETPPTPVTRLLEKSGFTILRVETSLLRPLISPLDFRRGSQRQWDTTSFVATLEVSRVREKFRPGGWQCLRAKLTR